MKFKLPENSLLKSSKHGGHAPQKRSFVFLTTILVRGKFPWNPNFIFRKVGKKSEWKFGKNFQQRAEICLITKLLKKCLLWLPSYGL